MLSFSRHAKLTCSIVAQVRSSGLRIFNPAIANSVDPDQLASEEAN